MVWMIWLTVSAIVATVYVVGALASKDYEHWVHLVVAWPFAVVLWPPVLLFVLYALVRYRNEDRIVMGAENSYVPHFYD